MARGRRRLLRPGAVPPALRLVRVRRVAPLIVHVYGYCPQRWAELSTGRTPGCFLSDPPPSVWPVTKRSSTASAKTANVGMADMAVVPDREKALGLALAQIDKQFGKGSVMRLGERPVTQTQVIPTGSIALDVALGIGGLPRGRIVEIYGPEASGKTTVALHAIANAQASGGTTAIFINQLREKIGIMFGCFNYSTRVTLADGTQEKIGKIVNQRMDLEVLSYDPATNRVEPRRIVNWFDNGPAERFLQFTVAKSGGNGRAQFAATENHLVRTPGGWRAAGELIAGDRVMVAEPRRLSEQQWQVVLGSLMGDGNVSPNLQDRSGVRFRLGHGAQKGRSPAERATKAAYLDWKVGLLSNIECSRRVAPNGAVFADFTPLAELDELRRAVYLGDGKKHLSWDYLKALTPLALAVWYMDDGRLGTESLDICVEAMSEGSRERLVEHLRDAYGLDVKLIRRGALQKCFIQFSTAATTKFQEIVAPYVPPAMERKLLPRFQGQQL